MRGLLKSYGAFQAVDGIDLDIRPGEIFALLGPNGAGKTTTVEILEGYRDRDGGRGHACSATTPRRRDPAWRSRIGIVLQSTGDDRRADRRRGGPRTSPASTRARATRTRSSPRSG